MRSVSTDLLNLLNTRRFERTDLYTLTLRGGTVIRWTSADKQMTFAGNTFERGPIIQRERIQDVVGLETSSLDMTLSVKSADPSDQYSINGVPLIEFISRQGLNGANLKLEKAFFPSWEDPVTGTILRFSGKVTAISGVSGLSAKLIVSSWALLLNVNYPVEVYQAGCMWTVYNEGCGLDELAFASVKTVGSGSTTTRVVVPSGGGASYQQGRILFLTGPNTGLSRTVRSSDSTSFEVIPPLPVAPASGNTFRASFGCDLSHGTCETRFNNLGRFKGTPFVPIPETSI